MHFEVGDIWVCHGTDAAARVIRWGTCVPWPFAPRGLRFGPSHVAICGSLEPATGGADVPMWIESTTLSRLPCVIQEKPVSGMQVHRPAERIAEYRARGGRVDLYRLAEIQTLDAAERALLNRILIEHMVVKGIRYDMTGAILSGTRAFKFTRLFPGASLNALFCSEVIAALLMRLNRMRRDNPTKFNPASLMRELVDHGTYYLHREDIPAE